MKRTALWDEHKQLGALMVNFAGWEMPLHYGSQVSEHHKVRKDCGVFDVSHMCSVDITGSEAKEFLRYLLVSDVNKLTVPNRALYTCIVNEQAQIIDDLICYYLDQKFYRLIVNAATAQQDMLWFNKKLAEFQAQSNSNTESNFDLTIKQRDDLAMLAIQGPNAWKKMTKVFAAFNKDFKQMPAFHCFMQDEWLVAATGYTGESGLELVLPIEDVIKVWQAIIKQDVAPIGLGARDSLRLEAGLNLYGQDMDLTTTPYEARLAWVIDLDDSRNFIGKDALINQKQSGVPNKLIGLVLQKPGICRANSKVYAINQDTNKMEQGIVTSGAFSPTLNRAIAFAKVPNQQLADFTIEIRGKKVPAMQVKLPFVKNGLPNFDLQSLETGVIS